MYRLDGQLSSRQLSKEVISTNTALYILFVNLAIRYKVMHFRCISPTLSANLQSYVLHSKTKTECIARRQTCLR